MREVSETCEFRMMPPINSFSPNLLRNLEPIFLEVAELEAFRLVGLEGLSQEEDRQRMEISRGTVWRLVQSAKKKTAQALTEGRPLYITSSASEGQPPTLTLKGQRL